MLLLIAAGIMLINTHPRFVLVLLAYTYLASAFIGMAITRFRRRGGRIVPEEIVAEETEEAPARDTAAL